MLNIAIFGAGGGQGSEIAHAASQAGHQIRLLLRNPSSRSLDYGKDAEIIAGDMEDRSAVEAAVHGAGVALLTVPLVFDAERMGSDGAERISRG